MDDAAAMTEDDDQFEVEELQRAAEWRMRQLDANPADAKSADAARHLERLAAEVARLRDTPLFQEYVAICNWLGESDGIAQFSLLANDYRRRIGFEHAPADGEAYLRALIDLAKQASGA
jgi:hypothetical protein